jgi:hypothetical protein
MRAFEFLIEKNLAPGDFYKKPRLDALLSKIKNNDDFIVDRQPTKLKPTRQELQSLKNFYQFYNDQGETRKSIATANLPKSIGGVELSRIAKTGEFGGRGGYSVEKANIGPAVEVLKATAIFTKLTDRTGNNITADQLMTTLNELKNHVNLGKSSAKSKTDTYQGQMSKEVLDVNNKVKDTVHLVISANEGPFLRALKMSPEDTQLQGILNAVLKYVNTEHDLSRYNKFFSTNNRFDNLNISVVGGEGNKTDVKTTYIDPDTKQERTLKNLSMSLKAGKGATLDQAPGTNEIGINKFFSILGLGDAQASTAITQSGYKGKVGKTLQTPEEHQARVEASRKILDIAGKNLEAKYFAKNDKGEAAFVSDFLRNLTGAMTKEESLIYVEFNANGTYNKLNPRKIQHLAQNVDLYCDPKVSTGGVSYLYIRDRNSGKSLFHIRLMVSKAERIAFFFELDDLLELVQKAESEVNQSSSQSVAKTPQPTNPKTPVDTAV